tara:strand:- start:213 stop:440 length:228 start_codon:yes stop_codon:yes gene_type:complete
MDENLQGLILLICVFVCLCCIIESTKDCEKCLMPRAVNTNPEKAALYVFKKPYNGKNRININEEYVALEDIKILR